MFADQVVLHAKSSITGSMGIDVSFVVTKVVPLTKDGKTLREKIIETNMGLARLIDSPRVIPQKKNKKMIDEVEMKEIENVEGNPYNDVTD